MARLLLIDKGIQSGDFLEKGLSLYGYTVITPSQPDTIFNLATAKQPDLILIDIDTPGINIWQTIQNMKASRLTWSIPVIAICNQAIDGNLLVQAGFDSYFRKPLLLKHLAVRIETLLKATAASRGIPPSPTTPPIPGTERIPPPQQSQLDSPQRNQAATVVYVDDSPKDSQAMANIITSAGYSYSNIADSLQALPLLLERRPQLIFLDLVMPMANGYELCAQIRRISLFSRTPIVIVTNNDGLVDRVRAKLVGASDFVSKPIEEKRILKITNKYLNSFQLSPNPIQEESFFSKIKIL